MKITGGMILVDLTPLEMEVLYHGCMAVEHTAMKNSNMEKTAREMRQKLGEVINPL